MKRNQVILLYGLPASGKYTIAKQIQEKCGGVLLACFNAKPKDKIAAIDKLYDYVMKSGGGFEIGQFRGKRKIEKR